MRSLSRIVVTGVLALAAVTASATPALAHATLESTEPSYGASLSPAPDGVLILYDLPVEVAGAQMKLERSGTAVRIGRPVHASPDHRLVSVPLRDLSDGSYLLTWFLFGTDGDVMGGELAFTVLPAVLPPGPAQGGPRPAPPASASSPALSPTFSPFSGVQDGARLLAFASLALLLGGVAFLAGLWPAGARLRRSRIVLWAALGTALVANAANLGLKGAAVSGRSALEVFTPAAVTALHGTHVGRVLTARLGFLLLAVPVVAVLTIAPHRALRSHRWFVGAAVAAVGALATHGMLSHAYARGILAGAADAVHLGAVSVWLGGLFMLAGVVLPRRRGEELAEVVPRWSRLAFASMAAAVGAGTVLLVLISPRWTALPGSGYGRFLLLKMVGVATLLVVAHRAREFARHHLPGLVAPGEIDLVVEQLPVLVAAGGGGTLVTSPEVDRAAGRLGCPPVLSHEALRPFLNIVALELTIAASILATTAILVGRPPPA
jgi:putative copper export protein/methionine-rich copper-binding protein CopC